MGDGRRQLTHSLWVRRGVEVCAMKECEEALERLVG